MEKRSGKELKQLRDRLGFTRAEVSFLTNVPIRTWERWEQDRSRPSGLAFAWLELYSAMCSCPHACDFVHALDEELYQFHENEDHLYYLSSSSRPAQNGVLDDEPPEPE